MEKVVEQTHSRITVVPILSGGLDSTVLTAMLVRSGYNVKPLGIDYGQKHRTELDYARRYCSRNNLFFEVADLTGITHLINNSSQTSSMEVPEGHYAEESMKLTVVPNRNMIMLSVACGYAINIKANFIAYGAHSGDHAIYPDCRTEFVEAMRSAIKLADWHPVDIISPFLAMTKAEIVLLGAEMGIPFEDTWSCYKGGDVHCGMCGTCTERIEAFVIAGVDDPTAYSLKAADNIRRINTEQNSENAKKVRKLMAERNTFFMAYKKTDSPS